MNKEESSQLAQLLDKQFRSTYDHTEWFVSFKNATAGLTHEQAIQKPSEQISSVFEIVAHLTYWNDRYLKKLRSEEQTSPMITDNDLTFSQSGHADWKALLEKAEMVFSGWVEVFHTLSENDDEHFSAIGNTSMHNAYHIGQIVIIRKMLGNWNPDHGVK